MTVQTVINMTRRNQDMMAVHPDRRNTFDPSLAVFGLDFAIEEIAKKHKLAPEDLDHQFRDGRNVVEVPTWPEIPATMPTDEDSASIVPVSVERITREEILKRAQEIYDVGEPTEALLESFLQVIDLARASIHEGFDEVLDRLMALTPLHQLSSAMFQGQRRTVAGMDREAFERARAFLLANDRTGWEREDHALDSGRYRVEGRYGTGPPDHVNCRSSGIREVEDGLEEIEIDPVSFDRRLREELRPPDLTFTAEEVNRRDLTAARARDNRIRQEAGREYRIRRDLELGRLAATAGPMPAIEPDGSPVTLHALYDWIQSRTRRSELDALRLRGNPSQRPNRRNVPFIDPRFTHGRLIGRDILISIMGQDEEGIPVGWWEMSFQMAENRGESDRIYAAGSLEKRNPDWKLGKLDKALKKANFAPSIDHEESESVPGKSKGVVAYAQHNAHYKKMIEQMIPIPGQKIIEPPGSPPLKNLNLLIKGIP